MPFYRRQVLDNQGIKLIKGNPNLSRNYIFPTELVDHF